MLPTLPNLPSLSAMTRFKDPSAWEWVLTPDNSYLGGGGSPNGMSRLLTASRCEREYGWQRGFGAVPAGLEHVYPTGTRFFEPEEDAPEPRTFGSIMHDVLAYTAVGPWRADKRPAWFHEMSLQDRLQKTAGIHQTLLTTAADVYAQYAAHHAYDEYEPVAVEALIKAQLRDLDPPPPGERSLIDQVVDDWWITGLVDALVRRRSDGSLWVLDYKTSRRRDWGWREMSPWQDSNNDEYFGQACTYLKILRVLGVPVRGFLVRRIKWSQPYDFDTNVVDISGLPYEEHGSTLRTLVKREVELIQRLEAGNAPAPNFTGCRRVWGRCLYWRACHVDSQEQRLVQLARFPKEPRSDDSTAGLSSIRPLQPVRSHAG